MNKRLFGLLTLAFAAGCATFNELEPVPPVQPAEQGFIELRNDQENFLLKKEEQYFMKFPRAADTHFYVLLQTAAKTRVNNYFTAAFDDGKGTIVPIKDETASHDSLSVYAIDTSTAFFYWVIDTVRNDLPLTLHYRYVPQWRYTVETKYDEYRRALADNKVERQSYETMGPQFNWAAFDAKGEQQNLHQRNMSLSTMNDALVELEKVFPANIALSNDTMYQRYLSLSKETKEELLFQSDYDAVLSIVQRESATRGDFGAFVGHRTDFAAFLEQKDRFRAPILDYARSAFLRRLSEALPRYDAQLKSRTNLTTVELNPAVADVDRFYQSCGAQLPNDVAEVRDFVTDFNTLAAALAKSDAKFKALPAESKQKVTWPEDSYYPNILTRLSDARKAIPHYTLDKYETSKEYRIASLLEEQINKALKRIDDLQAPYRRASGIVQKVNPLKAQRDYKGIIQILRENRDLALVLAHYPDIDELSLKAQISKARERLDSGDWSEAEKRLAELHSDKEYLNPSAIASKKLESVKSMEAEIYDKVKKLSVERADAFTKKNEITIIDVPALYADSSFLPAYVLGFSSESLNALTLKRRTIEDNLRQIKHYRFPDNAIRLVYKELTRAPHDQGVEKARAILDHARFYRGNDKTVRNIADECNPAIAKTLDKPKNYRRILVIPVNPTAKVSNEYVFRINVKIPSEAKFPVFDINIKVPKEIADKAGASQWFTAMTLNKKLIKTEGHMRITAPTADNDYEAQITPVQMDKAGDNIIEVRFNYPSFKLFEVSVMAQVPLIRKN